MKQFLAICTVLMLGIPSMASATLIDFDPSDTTADLGDTIAIDIVATPEAGELIGEYDFIVNFDPTILALDDLIFGPSLNDDEFFCSLVGCRGSVDVAGGVNLFELSLAFPLFLLQDGTSPIVLATLIFDTIGVGTSDLSFTGNIAGQSPPFGILGDEFGFPLPSAQPGTGSVTVVQVPEPSTLLLTFSGLVILLSSLRRRRILG